MIMKKVLIVLTLCCVAVACKKNDVSFSYSPQNPRAGQVVTFSNLSSTGEEWEWTFGDGGTSTLKSPSHTFKQPGEYDVILKGNDIINSETIQELFDIVCNYKK